MPEKFDKKAREQVYCDVAVSGSHLAEDYIKALEEVAKLAALIIYPHSSDVVFKLDAALEHIDWMRE